MASYTSSLGVSGLSSGLDWTSIIQQLVAVEQRPVLLLQQKEVTLTSRLTAIKDVNSSLLALKSKAFDLSLRSSIVARSVNVTGTDMTATAGADAAIGSHKVTIYNVATATRSTSTSFLGNAASTSAALAQAGMGTAPTVGTFSINNTEIYVENTTWTSDVMEHAATSGTVAGGISSDAQVTFSYKGVSYTTAALAEATDGVTTLSAVASDLQSKMNAALGSAGTVAVTVDDSAGPGNGKLVVTGALVDMSVTSVAGTDTTALAAMLASGGATKAMDTIDGGAGSIVTKINNAGLGIVATVEHDAQGRDNILKLYRADGGIDLGSGGDTSNFLTAARLYGADPFSTWTSGVAESASVEGTIAGDFTADARVTFSYRGTAYQTGAGALTGGTHDSTTLEDVASELEAAINAQLGEAGSVTVTVDDASGTGNAKFIITDDETGGELSLTGLSGTDTTGLEPLLAGGGATSGETILSMSNMGTAAAGAYLYDSRMATTLKDAMQSGIVESSTASGKASFTLAGTETVSFSYHGVSYTTAALGAVSADLTDLTDVAADLQAKMNAEIGGAGSVTVSVLTGAGTGQGRLVVTDESPTGGSSMSFSFASAPSGIRLTTSDGAQAKGAFTVNGVNISYDKYHDTLNSVINRINASGANVLARYDATQDRLVLTSSQTGSASISVEDSGGNFLAATYASGTADQVLGSNARYSIDTVNGGAVMTSASNIITDAIAGMVLRLSKASSVDDEGELVATTVTVGQNNQAAIDAVQAFITSYNDNITKLADYTAYDASTEEAGILNGNAQAREIYRRLRSLVGASALGYVDSPKSLSDLGITLSTAAGAAMGSVQTLSLDTEEFQAALDENPNRVYEVLAGYAGAVSLETGGTGTLSAVSGRPTTQTSAGTYRIVSDSSGNMTAYFQPEGGSETLVGTAHVDAGGTNTSLIPGVTLYAKSTYQAGTDYLKKDASQTGVLKDMELYVDEQSRTGGLLSNAQDTIEDQIEDLEDQIETMLERITIKQQEWTRKFAAMETQLSRMQTQANWLTQQLLSINSNWMGTGE